MRTLTVSFRRVVAFGLLSATFGCATYATVKRLQPGEIKVRKGERVAVSPLRGNDGEPLRLMLGPAITRSDFLQLIDRTHLDSILAEQRRAVEGITRDDSLRVGELAAAEALINGEASARSGETRQRRNEVCTEYDPRTKKRVGRPCVLQTAETTVEYVAQLSFVDTSTGQVKAKRNFRKVKRDSNQSYAGMPIAPPAGPLIEACRSEVVEEFMKVISPYEVREDVKLVTDGQVPQLEAGNKFAVAGNWQQAAQFYGQAAQLVSGGAIARGAPKVQAKAYYSLGLALTMQGEYARGLEYLNRASGLDPNDDYISLTMRASQWAKDSARLAPQQSDAEQTAP